MGKNTKSNQINQIKQKWLHGNKLSLNVVETQSLIIGSRPNIQKIEKQTEAKPSFEIGDQKINMTTDTKYLGVQIDDKLQWDRHIEQVKAKAPQALGLINPNPYGLFSSYHLWGGGFFPPPLKTTLDSSESNTTWHSYKSSCF